MFCVNWWLLSFYEFTMFNLMLSILSKLNYAKLIYNFLHVFVHLFVVMSHSTIYWCFAWTSTKRVVHIGSTLNQYVDRPRFGPIRTIKKIKIDIRVLVCDPSLPRALLASCAISHCHWCPLLVRRYLPPLLLPLSPSSSSSTVSSPSSSSFLHRFPFLLSIPPSFSFCFLLSLLFLHCAFLLFFLSLRNTILACQVLVHYIGSGWYVVVWLGTDMGLVCETTILAWYLLYLFGSSTCIFY